MKYIYAVCFLLLVCGCHKENDTPVVLPARTLLVYLGGDNNLDAETYDKLVQIKNGWEDGTDGNIIVYQDTPFKDSPRLMEIDGKSEKGYITIHTYDQENSASPQVLKRVINDVTRLYPAKSYGLIVFSHGSGWLPPHTLVNGSRSIIIDNDNEMEITDFAMALPDHLFEFIIFEACNMAGIEVAYELRNKAAYIMASSAPVVSPGFTPIYAGSISCLLEENADLQRFAENYFHYWNLMEGDKRSATISIIKTAGLSNLANLIRQINTEISGSFLPVGNLQNYDGVLKAPFYFFDFFFIIQISPTRFGAFIVLRDLSGKRLFYYCFHFIFRYLACSPTRIPQRIHQPIIRMQQSKWPTSCAPVSSTAFLSDMDISLSPYPPDFAVPSSLIFGLLSPSGITI